MPTDRPTILIVEDEADLAELIRYNFDVDQYDTVVAHDGRRALDYLDQHTPDLVILDVMLPHVSGVEIA
ncbi:MAG: response regulator, partial [Pseudomonadota bacterium]